jgi:hypothetical protein
MQDFDPIEEHFRKTFSGRESDPPENSWLKISSRLQASDRKGGGISKTIERGSGFIHSSRFYPVLAVAAMLVLILFIWISYSDKHTIRGHAYAGEGRLCKGTAYLYKVIDKAEPVDSGLGKPVQTVRVDMKGFYQFTGISQGNYVIKVAPDSGSEAIRNFLPSFYDQNSEEKKANLVRIGKEDPTIDIHLQPK